jgi:hypothetical protein
MEGSYRVGPSMLNGPVDVKSSKYKNPSGIDLDLTSFEEFKVALI